MTYVVIILSLFAGYFEYVFIFLFIIVIHELGHLFMAQMLGFKVSKVILYPFGGLTKYDGLLNSEKYKEFLILIGGPLSQIIFFFIIRTLFSYNLVNSHSYEIVKSIHAMLISFNMLPIIPLDGSKFLNLLFDNLFSYKFSHKLTIIISIIVLPIVIIFNYKLLFVMLIIILIKSIIKEIYSHKYKINKFLLERALYNFNFKKGKIIDNIYKIKRGKKHKIKTGNHTLEDSEYIKNMFDLKLKL